MPKPQPLEAGQPAPEFHFEIDGTRQSSSALQSYCLLYFYPKDNTPGCNKEACAFRDEWTACKQAGLMVVGVSKDNQSSHDKFRDKFSLPFPLIADTELELAQAYGVWGEKKFMGKTFDGIHRMSFLINPQGTIVKTYTKVKPAEHASQVLADLPTHN